MGMQSLVIFGRQPALGLAEVESLYGSEKIRRVGAKVAIIDIDPCLLAFDRLGGSTKFCKILTTLDTTNWKEIEKFLLQVAPGHSQNMPEGKMRLGLSIIGMGVSLGKLEATGLTLKKSIRKTGRSVRLVPNNKAPELNSAQVIHNQLTGPTGWELVFIRDAEKTIIAQSVKVQDITSYTKRDRERPKRDSKVGMLPPKLAQIIINLSVGNLPEDKLESICDIPAGEPIPRKLLGKTVLDPFCGTGVVLQEAALMGYEVAGTDLEQRMIDYSEANIAWLSELYNEQFTPVDLEKGDATTHNWNYPVDFVACESYLGRPFTSMPDGETLARTISECNSIIKKFLQNIHGQLEFGTRLCVAVPAWQHRPGKFKFLPLVDQIEDLGYTGVSFEHIRDDELLYYRDDQVVARQLLVITRK